jgi:FkbM family methyltransferase
MTGKTDLFVRTHFGDLSFCSYCLRFLERFWIEPDCQIHVLTNPDCEQVTKTWGFSDRVRYHFLKPWPDGNQFACYLVITADRFTDAEFCAFIDADCMLLQPLQASDLMENANPLIWYRNYQDSGPVTVPRRMWAPIMRHWLQAEPQADYMQRFPFIFRTSTLRAVQEMIERRAGTTLEQALYSDVPYDPAKFLIHPFKMCEFNVISFYAHLHERDRYVFRDIETVKSWPVKQYWSWGWDQHHQAEMDRLLAQSYPERLAHTILPSGWMVLSDDVTYGHSSLVAQSGRMDVDVGGLPTHEFIRPYLKAGSTAIDVGAHIGTHTVTMMQALGPQGRVYAFEPHPDIFPVLKHNVKKQSLDSQSVAQCVTLPYAAGSNRGLVQFFCNPINYASNTLLSNVFDCKSRIEVEITTLDFIIPDEEDDICFIKIDVEGGEWDVIHGAEKLIRRCHPAIFMEFSENFLPMTGISDQEFYDYLRSLDYSRFIPFPQEWILAGHHAHDLLVLP